MKPKAMTYLELPTVVDDVGKWIGAVTLVSGAIISFYKFCLNPIIAWGKKRRDLYKNVEKLVTELSPNGGASLRDAINRIELLLLMESESRRQQMNAVGLAFWESNAEGLCTYASENLAELMGTSREDVLGNRWVGNLIEEDKTRVFNAWNDAVTQQRRFSTQYTFEHEDGKLVRVHGEAQPLMLHNKIIGWVGVLRELKD